MVDTAQRKSQAIAFVKAYQHSFSHIAKATNQPTILRGLGRIDINIDESFYRIFEAGIQALIFGNLNNGDINNFYGVTEAFALAHEYGHVVARGGRNGVILDVLSADASNLLCGLTADSMPREAMIEWWTRLDSFNTYIKALVERFEPLEEICATYLGLRFSPIEVRNQVEGRVEEDLGKRNWLEAYKLFAEVCDSWDEPFNMAVFVFETICRMLEQNDCNVGHIVRNIDYTSIFKRFSETFDTIWSNIEIIEQIAQEKGINLDALILQDIRTLRYMVENEDAEAINHILEQAERDFSWFAAATIRIIVIPSVKHRVEAAIHLDGSHDEEGIYTCAPQISLTGWEARKFITFGVLTCVQEYKTTHTPLGRIFFESLRQQLDQDCSEEGSIEGGHKIVCPFSFMSQCCGYKDQLRVLFEHLPEERKKHFQPPDCNRPFNGYSDELRLHPQQHRDSRKRSHGAKFINFV